jgi:hypothetical protein
MICAIHLLQQGASVSGVDDGLRKRVKNAVREDLPASFKPDRMIIEVVLELAGAALNC